MKLSIKIVLIIIVIFILILAGLYTYINMYGKTLLVNKLKDAFNREVKISSLKVYLPFNIMVEDVEVQDLFSIDKVFATGCAIDILKKDFTLSELRLERLVVNIEWPLKKPLPQVLSTQIPSVTNQTGLTSPKLAIIPLTVLSRIFRFSQFYLKRLVINDAAFNFMDRSVQDKGLRITVKDLNINVENLKFPIRGFLITSFDLKCKIPWQQGKEEGRIEAQGWLNLFKKDMQVTLKIEDIDGIYLYPYYSKWVDLEKSRVEKAKLNFTSDTYGLNNDLTVTSNLELTDIVFRPRQPDEPQEKAEKVAVAVLGIFKELDQGKVVLPFTFKTKMDRPQFNLDRIREAFEYKITQQKPKGEFKAEDVLKLPTKLIEGTVKGATDITKSVIIGTVSAGKEITSTVLGTFKKKSTAPTENKESTNKTTDIETKKEDFNK